FSRLGLFIHVIDGRLVQQNIRAFGAVRLQTTLTPCSVSPSRSTKTICVFRTSMEIGVKVTIERLLTGERLHTCSAYLTFVGVDRQGNKIVLPPVIPE